MLQKKICLLGVGPARNRLAWKHFQTCFSEQYQSTIGVSIHRKQVDVDGTGVNLILWNLASDDSVSGDTWHTASDLRSSYLRGMSGYALVIDNSDPDSERRALRYRALARQTVGEVPAVTLQFDDTDVAGAIHEAAMTRLIDGCFEQLVRDMLRH